VTGREDIALLWSARLARLDVASRETRPRILTADTVITLRWPSTVVNAAPLTTSHHDIVGQVMHVDMTWRWLVAFGAVTDGETADLMRRGDLTPEFALTEVRTTPPAPDQPRTITHGVLAAVRTRYNPRFRPGPEPLWSGLRFTVEDHLP
jgi:hypothetical protein